MALNLKRLKQIDDHEKSPVFGYIRRVQKELTLLNVPIMIYYLCLGYYFMEEYFEKSANEMEISENKLTVIHQHSEREYKFRNWPAAWCKKWINSNIDQIAKWKIKIENKNIKRNMMLIRLTSHDKLPDQRPNYGFYASGATYTDELRTGAATIHGSVAFTMGDTLTIVLNTKEKTIGLIKNKEKIHIIWSNIEYGKNIRYKLCIRFGSVGNTVSLIDYCSQLL